MKQKLIGQLKKGLLFVISAPAGTGKTTLARLLLKEFPEDIVQSISCTTRPPREKEVEGKDYFFLDEKEFEQKKKNDELLEYATVFHHQYGTLKEEVEKKQREGKHVLLVIDTQGAIEIKKRIDIVSIFILPPSLEELSQRLKGRKTERLESLRKRLDWAKHELEQVHHYDYKIINDDLTVAYQVLKSIIIAEEHRLSHQN